MRRFYFLLILGLFSISLCGQTKLSQNIKGSWTTRDRVCITAAPQTPDSLQWSINSYQFNITIKNILGMFKTYAVSTFYYDSLGMRTTTFLKRGRWNVDDNSSTIDIVELRMENHICNCLINKSDVIKYKVVWVKEGWMTWIPQNVPWYDTSDKNRTVFWMTTTDSNGGEFEPSNKDPNHNVIIATK